jgi:hypothetical protein
VESSGALPFVHRAEAVYVFPVTTPMEPRRNDKHLRLLGPRAAQSIVQVLGKERNWYNGLYTIVEAADQPTNVGLLFRAGRDELVLFFSEMTVQGTFRGKRIAGMLEDKPRSKFDEWKRRYAQPELAVKMRSNQSMKPTAPWRYNPSVFATTPCRGLSLSR